MSLSCWMCCCLLGICFYVRVSRCCCCSESLFWPLSRSCVTLFWCVLLVGFLTPISDLWLFLATVWECSKPWLLSCRIRAFWEVLKLVASVLLIPPGMNWLVFLDAYFCVMFSLFFKSYGVWPACSLIPPLISGGLLSKLYIGSIYGSMTMPSKLIGFLYFWSVLLIYWWYMCYSVIFMS